MIHKILVERYNLKFRKVKLLQKVMLSNNMMRISFQGKDLSDFRSLSPDDHVKLFFPDPCTGILLEPINQEGQDNKANLQFARDYTPVRFDIDQCILEIDFFLHGAGVGSDWAKQAKEGDTIFIGGPRGSRILPYDFDWYLLIGDETAIPAIERRLYELPYGSHAIVVLEISDMADKRSLVETQKNIIIHWILKEKDAFGQSSKDLLIEFLIDNPFPKGDYYTWIALEAARARGIKHFILEEKNANPEWVKASGYWKKTISDNNFEEKIEQLSKV